MTKEQEAVKKNVIVLSHATLFANARTQNRDTMLCWEKNNSS